MLAPDLTPSAGESSGPHLALLLAASPTLAQGTAGVDGALLATWAVEANDGAYTIAMLFLGLGSLPFCRALLRSHLIPRPLALWGLLGYAVVAVGMGLELVGYGIGMAVWIPGGLFEVALGVLLVVRGFPRGAAPVARRDQSDAMADA
ncbi:DUF4386 domain-containing protein [Actinotalea sp. K2]|uniref:DUF4386 domain-containing protein n=1 Tax=Actinotalea sp. K2 TaxID=2939438 RepID=UPI002016DE81|nr:DUF4386 domain-containing protein [Actinotalea sp. K2]MCL3861557.1 DUF4386 domain-containing protein [Actinotalea sp. K2]